jgi:ribosome-associated toxin RatA of RatAB toxin-antitoxin module
LRSRIDIDVGAPAEVVFRLAHNVAKWPAILPHYQKVTVLSRQGTELLAQMRATRRVGRFGIPVGWTARTWADPSDSNDMQLRFVHTAGPTRGMDVTWHITPRGTGGSNVAIVHDFARPLPLLGSELFPAVVDRFFVRPIAGQTLATFKRLAEAKEDA